MRSSALGGNLFDASAVPAMSHPNDAAAEESDLAEAAASMAAAQVTERENLIRTLGSILRSKPTPTSAPGDGARKVGSAAAPSSNVPSAVVPEDAKAHLVAAAEKLELAGALVAFLPPARSDGAEGVTVASVALRPEWCAPPAVTANVCVCLLHLLDGELSGRIAEQVRAWAGSHVFRVVLFALLCAEGRGVGGVVHGPLQDRTRTLLCHLLYGKQTQDFGFRRPQKHREFFQDPHLSAPCFSPLIGGRRGWDSPPHLSLRQLGGAGGRSFGTHQRRHLPGEAGARAEAQEGTHVSTLTFIAHRLIGIMLKWPTSRATHHPK